MLCLFNISLLPKFVIFPIFLIYLQRKTGDSITSKLKYDADCIA